MKTPEEIIRQPKYNSLVNLVLICEAMEEYASQFQQPKKCLKERKQDFLNKIMDVNYELDRIYSALLLDEFFNYWTEHGDIAKKMRFEKEKVFDIKKRLERWKRNQKNFNNGKPEKRSTESAAHSFITE
jgi:hypothetical protein